MINHFVQKEEKLLKTEISLLEAKFRAAAGCQNARHKALYAGRFGFPSVALRTL